MIAVAGILYLLACIIVGAVANERDWDFFTPFIVSLIASPIVGAILYSPYKKEDKSEPQNP
jgi:hypothetical protein